MIAGLDFVLSLSVMHWTLEYSARLYDSFLDENNPETACTIAIF